MARLLRGYPSRMSGVHNARIVAVATPAFLPTGPRKLVAVRRTAEASLRRPLSSRLRPPTVINPIATALFLPTLGRYQYAAKRAAQSSTLRPRSTRLRSAAVINRPPAFLPTGPRVLFAVRRRAIPGYNRTRSVLRPPAVVTAAATSSGGNFFAMF